MYLKTIPSSDKEKIRAVKQNMSRYMLRLEAKQRKSANQDSATTIEQETAGVFSSSGKIVKHELVAIFMTILMYSPVGRRDYLAGDISIEEDFKAEVDNIEKLGKLYDIQVEFFEENSMMVEA